MRFILIFLAFSFLVACGGGGGGSSTPTAPAPVQATPPPPASADPIAEQLTELEGLGFEAFTEASFEMLIRREPESAVSAGLLDVDPALDDLSEAHVADTLRLIEGLLTRLQTYTPADEASQTLYSIYEFYLQDRITAAGFADFTYPASYFLTSVPSQTLFFFTDIQPLETQADASEYLARLRLVDTKIDQVIDAVNRAEAAGVIMPRVLLDGSINRHQQIAGSSVLGNPYYTRFNSDVRSIAMELRDRDELLAGVEAAIENEIVPAYNRLIAKLQNQQAAAPSAVGVGQFTGGQDFYNYALRHHTTTSLTSDAIHDLGILELERIHAEMNVIFEELGYPNDSITANLGRAANDGGSIAPSGVVGEYERILDEAAARLGEAFGVLPAAELIVIGGQQGGFYVRPAPDGSRPGAFYASNTRAEPAYQMRSLAYHEGVPGHHLQIALSQEQGESLIQQTITFTGFVEGWALYAERLAFELGWYDGDPLGNLGRLQYEAFRAARLVVDTGIHQRGWSFNDASIFFANNTGFSRNTADNQIARYAAWPGQATAYMVGMLKILEHRAEAKNDPAFDLKSYHDALLARGSVPLTMLDDDG